MERFIFFISLFLFSIEASTCDLPEGEKIKVGCSYECNFFYRFRINLTALQMGYPVEFVNLNDHKNIKEALKEVDGILLPGGADIDPRYYMDSISPELREYTKRHLHLVNYSREGKERDPFEFLLVKNYSEDDSFKNLPMLGICRGMQMMSVAQGIPLYLDIKTELGIKNRYNRFDKVNISPLSESLMQNLFKDESLMGFKLHHQGIRVPYFSQHQLSYPLVRVTAFSNKEKIAEAIEYIHRPAIGLQFHPERSFSSTSKPILRWFLKKACEKKVSYKGKK